MLILVGLATLRLLASVGDVDIGCMDGDILDASVDMTNGTWTNAGLHGERD
jgi:hypothetical protein